MNTALQSIREFGALLTNESGTDFAHLAVLSFLTATGFMMAAICFAWYTNVPEIPILLLGLVTFGMSYDFLSHVLGTLFPRAELFLNIYSRVNFAALCFGIPFTALAATFVMARVVPEGLSAALADQYLPILHTCCAFGLLFLFARYKKFEFAGAVEFTLNKTAPFTRTIFLLRRILLAASLVVAILALIDAWNTDFRAWALLFVGIFTASVPLHIRHMQISSMLSELLTQALAMYATWLIFVVPA